MSSKTNFSGNFNRSYLEINQDKGWFNNKTGTLRQAFMINISDKADFSPAYNLNVSKTSYRDMPPSYGSVLVTTQSFESRLFLKGAKKSTLEFTYEYQYNSQAVTGLGRRANLIGSSLSIPIVKEQKGVLKLSAFDLFNQNIAVSRQASINSITDTRDNIILKRYFLITYVVNFRKA